MVRAPPSTSLVEDIQILRPERPSGGWQPYLPQHGAPLASFYHAQRSASPSDGSGSEGERVVRLDDPNRILPPPPNIGAAAIFMDEFLRREWPTGKYAISGGFAMIMHGSSRATFDVDICVDGQHGGLPLRPMVMNQR